MNIIPILISAFLLLSCSEKNREDNNNEKEQKMETSAPVNASVNYKPKVIARLSHDKKAYTQGLIYKDGFIYESSGQYGSSAIRKIDPETGKVLLKKDLIAAIFAEGMTILNDKIYFLTWLENTCFVYNLKTLSYEKQFQYTGEGWGLTDDGKQLIMSTGSSWLYFRNPDNFSVTSSLQVNDNGYPLTMLNELEYVNGLIYANVYMTEKIAVIDAKSGNVISMIDFSFLRSELADYPEAEVLNGIAYDKEKNRFFVTGKYWPYMYVVQFEKY